MGNRESLNTVSNSQSTAGLSTLLQSQIQHTPPYKAGVEKINCTAPKTSLSMVNDVAGFKNTLCQSL